MVFSDQTYARSFVRCRIEVRDEAFIVDHDHGISGLSISERKHREI